MRNTRSPQTAPGGAGYNTALGDGVDVLMGGGRNHFTPWSASNKAGRADGRDLLAEFRGQGLHRGRQQDGNGSRAEQQEVHRPVQREEPPQVLQWC